MKFSVAFGILFGIIISGETAPSNKIQIQRLNRNIADFSNFWFKFVSEETDRNNVIASPISAWIALALMSCGASGSTKTQIDNSLHFPLSDNETKNMIQQIIQGFKVPTNIEMKMANKLFLQSGFGLKQKFVDKIENILHSEVQSINFNEKINASKTINEWVEFKTNNRIKDLTDSDDINNAQLFLVNTIYFKAEWKDTFSKRATSLKPFYINSSTTKNVQMMYQDDGFLYGNLANANAQFVVLPYVNKNFYMVVIVPNEIDGLKEVESKFENINFDGLLASGRWQNLLLSMPKFKIESTLDLEPIFTKMGMTNMFKDGSADFSDITDDYRLKIDRAVQKTFIEVNEVGTEAAVATGIKQAPIVRVQQSIRLKIDRPFLFSIIMDSGDIRHQLFRGRIVDPLYE